MMYPFMTLEDNTEIVHSERLENGEVKVYIETPDEKDCFHSMTCYLPSYRIEVDGYSEKEIHYFMDIIKSTANLIIEFSKEGGFMNASGF
jgi:hypothetical protein|nr:hypothetical protein [uncultured Schaedlerella sp.]